MNTTKKVLGVIGSGLLLANAATAQVTSTSQLTGGINTITTAVPFLMICPDSRAGGMGEVGAATTPDANSIHWNGSKLIFAENKSGVSISYTPWLRQLVPDINLAYVSGYSKVSKNTAIGASLRYFSLGNITFTDIVGNTTGQFRPNEFAIDVCASQKLSQVLSMGFAVRYIYSNLTGNYTLSNGQATRPGKSVAADVSVYYQSKKIEINDKKSQVSLGMAITNIGQKISYSVKKDFIPINLRLGGGLKINADDYNQFGIYADANKLLVPTPPIYAHTTDSTGAATANIAYDPTTGDPIIAAGKDPNVPVAQGMVQSFGDAPGGAKEELKEINYSVGVEYWYGQPKQFAVRAGYFHEDKTKGNRKFFTVGIGVRYNVFGLDLAYLIPTTQRNPLQNTLRFTLMFNFDAFKDQNKDTPKAE